MAMGAAWKLRRVIGNVKNILAIELLCGAQGIDFRRPLRSSALVEQAHAAVRAVVPSMVRDRPVSPDILLVADAIAAAKFSDIAD
jgi:histidine ammonia-lyase